MDIPWDQYKPILRRAYFGDNESCLAPRDSETTNDFWQFFKKYLTICQRKQIKSDRHAKPSTSDLRETSVLDNEYSKHVKTPYIFEISATAKYALREVSCCLVFTFQLFEYHNSFQLPYVIV